MAGRHLGCYGWDAVAWPTEIGTTMTIPLIRNTSGHQIDEAERLHRAAGVTYHKAHHALVPERCQCGGGKPPAVPAWQMPRGYEGGPALPGRRRVGRVAPARAVADRLRRVAAPGRPPGMAGPFSADNCHYPLSQDRISVDNDVPGSAVAGTELSG
jgi:hypothetical protein